MNRNALAIGLAISLLASAGAFAQDQSEFEDLRRQVQQLEERLDQQSQAANSEAASSSSKAITGNAFNPALSLILDAKYKNLELDPDSYQIGGFLPAAGHEAEGGHAHGGGPGERGFGIDESELTISANIDPYFLGYFTAALADEEVEVEEAYIQNSGFVPGLIVKAGRFFSGIGYLNEQHPHSWDFTDSPLVSRAFMGGNLGEDGIQLRYIAPTPLFLEFGVEGGRGASFPGSERAKNGFNSGAVFVHLGGDVGFSHSYRVGTSYRETRASERKYDDLDAGRTVIKNVFSDLKSKTHGVDFVWKWAPEGDSTAKSFTVQAEYFRREENGRLGYHLNATTGTFAQEGGYSSKQKGWYAQAVHKFTQRWRAGLRYDQLDSGSLEYAPISAGSISRNDLQLLREHSPKRTTLMVDFSTSEFARFRLQYAQDKARFNETDDQIVFQYIVSLGAHGAHKF